MVSTDSLVSRGVGIRPVTARSCGLIDTLWLHVIQVPTSVDIDLLTPGPFEDGDTATLAVSLEARNGVAIPDTSA